MLSLQGHVVGSCDRVEDDTTSLSREKHRVGGRLWWITGMGCVTASLLLAQVGCGKATRPSADVALLWEAMKAVSAPFPEDFPSDVPTYPGWGGVSVLPPDPSKALSVAGSTLDSVDEVASFYEKRLPEAGWVRTNLSRPQLEAKVVNGRALTYVKEGRGVMIIIARSEEPSALKLTGVLVNVWEKAPRFVLNSPTSATTGKTRRTKPP